MIPCASPAHSHLFDSQYIPDLLQTGGEVILRILHDSGCMSSHKKEWDEALASFFLAFGVGCTFIRIGCVLAAVDLRLEAAVLVEELCSELLVEGLY